MAQQQQSAKKKCAKAGRNSTKCQRYALRRTALKNKLRKLRKHLRRQPGDLAAVANLERLDRTW